MVSGKVFEPKIAVTHYHSNVILFTSMSSFRNIDADSLNLSTDSVVRNSHLPFLVHLELISLCLPR